MNGLENVDQELLFCLNFAACSFVLVLKDKSSKFASDERKCVFT